ncbi:heavy metal efflux pump, CzcA family [Leptospira inadai serovar Lyme str. 10]|uniref:Heavy metal efflux pump, CzcA family n=2 Tax=Leptospira inadai serovar Lyme TaxID=293084 RepID=V6HD33_9LEPT|nr:CusA/CzcA family heavy metal efflux RND transporter [Leptospira inadai]EQA36898.1 heavy metal efflux pump, CzcA family [Leptospira inadai serovar Lyme str. 10]PNV75677.1 CusA/CzcA family heavy metal efflux RND transporter [Leptospira inadai serovar Lyme]
MIRRLIEGVLNFRISTLIAAGLAVLLGIWAWIDIRKEAYSDIADTQVRLIAKFPGKAAVEVEERVTLPIERVLNAIPRVVVRRSRTINGLVVFQFVFEDGTDDYFARMRLLERVRDADIPPEVEPSLGPMSSPVGEIFRYVVESSQNHTAMELRSIQDWIVMPKMLQIPGIADVVTFGGLPKQFHVVTSPDKLVRYKLTINDVIQAIQANNLNTGGNLLLQGEQGFPIRSLGAIREPKHIEDIVVKTVNGVPVYVRDLGTVEISHPIPSGVLGFTIQNDHEGLIDVDSSVQGLVAMRRWGDPNEMGERIRAKVKEINENYLPDGVRLRTTYDRTDLVNYTLRTIGRTLIEGIVVVSLVLIFFIGSVKASLVVVATIPFAMLFAFLLMNLTGIPASLLSLGAIDFGIIVDGAVIMVENIMRRYRDATPAEKQNGILAFTRDSAAEVGTEILFSILIIVLAYLPIFSFERIEGRLFKPMAFTISFAILGALVFAMTVIPVAMSFLYRKYFESANPGPIEWHNPIYGWVEIRYKKLIEYLVERSKKVVTYCFTIVLALLIIGGFKLGTEFLPEMDEGGFNLRIFFPVGISLPESRKFIPKIRQLIYKNEQVNVVLSQLGRNDDGTDPLPPNRLEVLVGLKDYDDWKEKITKQELLLRMRNDLEAGLPGVRVSFSQPIMDNLSEAIMGTIADLAVFVSGNDLKVMRKIGEEVLDIVKDMEGASEYGIEQEADSSQLTIRIDREAAARYGINVSDVQQMIEAAIGMQRISTLYEGPSDIPPKTPARFGIVVRFSKDYRASQRAIENMPIISPKGERIPLSELAKITLEDGPTMIFRQEGRRTVTVRTNIRGRDQGGFVNELRKKVEAKVKLPEGYQVRYGGQYENLARVGARLATVIPLTILIIFGVLYLLYRNLKYVYVALACLPLSLVGGIYALLLRGYYFNVSGGVGFISLFGIATMSGVLFVSRTNHLLKDEPDISTKEAVAKAAVIQLRPMLMTMLLALLGLIPATLASGVGSDVQRPLATVIVGGLFSAMLLVLTVLPSLYLILVGERNAPTAGSNVKGNSLALHPEAYRSVYPDEEDEFSPPLKSGGDVRNGKGIKSKGVPKRGRKS